MDATVQETSQESARYAHTVAQLHARALQELCAQKAELWLSEILISSESDSVKAAAILDIVIRRSDFPSVQVRAFHDLKALDASAARRFAQHICREPLDEDRDHIRARALATLVELPGISPTEALLVADGLRCRFPAVTRAVNQAIDSLTRVELDSLRQAAAQCVGADASKVAPLAAKVKEAYQTAPVRHQADPLKREGGIDALSAPKRSHGKVPNGEVSNRPARTRFRPARASSVPAINSHPAVVDRPPRISPPPAPEVRQVDRHETPPESLAPVTLPPRPVASTASGSLDALRDSKLLHKTWQELLIERDQQRDPRKICAFIAEMVARFPIDLVRDAAATSLIYVVSQSDLELKRMGALLVDHLFREPDVDRGYASNRDDYRHAPR